MAWLDDAAVERIIAAVGAPLAPDPTDPELTPELHLDQFREELNLHAQCFLEAVAAAPRKTHAKRALRPLFGRLHGAYMVHLDRRLGTSTHHTTEEALGPLVEFTYHFFRELRSAITRGAPVPDGTVHLLLDVLEDRPRGLTRRAMRSQLQRGVWNALGMAMLLVEAELEQGRRPRESVIRAVSEELLEAQVSTSAGAARRSIVGAARSLGIDPAQAVWELARAR